MSDRERIRPLVQIPLRWPTLILIAAAVTFATVFILNPYGGYGFPLAWKREGCPAPGIAVTTSCLLAIGYDWLSFSIDVVSYTAVGFGLLLAYRRYRWRYQRISD